ncbi:PilZ domain-containing protein [Thioalkalicoccus limnaeus]|uniref:PilZ domain-containing protein n=1 Tax=Thioalkalicoccus limnaeus TaxID=120681 RepID=A0ABV4BF79_9GAMM
MSVERRYSTRHPVDFLVYIRYRRRRFSEAAARNLSVQGLYLDVRALTVPTGTFVELEFDCLGREWLLPALVIHRESNGIGIMFCDPQPELYRGVIETHAHHEVSRPDLLRPRRPNPWPRLEL